MADISALPLQDYGSILTSYGKNIADTNAQDASANLNNAQAAGANLENKKRAMQNTMLANMIKSMQAPPTNDQSPSAADTSGVSGTPAPPPAGDTPSADASGTGPSGKDPSLADIGIDDAHITSNAAKQFAVKDVWSQRELQGLNNARQIKMQGAVAGIPMPDMTTDIIKAHEASITDATSRAALGASKLYDQVAAVADAPDGAAQETLRRIHPEMAASIDSYAKARNLTPEQTDKITRQFANDVGNAVHKYSGRDLDVGTDGVARDKVTNRPVTGGNPAGLSSQQWTELGKAADTPVSVVREGRETQIPQWQFNKSPSRTAWINQHAIRGIPAEHALGTPPATPDTVTIPGGAGGTSGVAPAPTKGGTTPATGGPAPASSTALSPQESAYVKNGPPAPSFLNTGTGKPNPGDTESQTQYQKDRAATLDHANSEAAAAHSTLVNANRARAALAGATTLGPGSSAWAEVGTLMRNWTGRQAADAIENSDAMRQLLGKELGQDQLNTILSKLHGDGASVRLGAQESNLILSHLSANPELSRFAINQMLDWETSDAQYAIGKSRAARAWVNAGRDVQQFNYEDNFPRDKNVQTNVGPPPGVGRSGAIDRTPGAAARNTGPPPANPANPATAPVQIRGAEDYAKLAPGTEYIDPQGVHRKKAG